MTDSSNFMNEWPIIGHTWSVQQMQTAVTRDEVPHALLITGPESVGKTTLALVLAKALLCQSPVDVRPCETCLACRKINSGNHPDFKLVEADDKGRLKIDQIRAVERFLALTPNESKYKVALINNFDQATIGAANALLKTLEEPPAYAKLMLLAGDPDSLLPTIVSRSQQLHLRSLSPTLVEQALVSRWEIPPEQAARLARISGGRIGWAIKAATTPEYHLQMETTLKLLLDLLEQDIPARFECAKTLSLDPQSLPETLEYWLTGWRDLLLIHTSHSERVVHRDSMPNLERVARAVSLTTILGVIQTLEEALSALLSNANALLLLENIMLELPQLG